MIALDTNILIGIMVSSSSLHADSMKGLSNLSDDLCITPTNVGETLRILTHSKIFPAPLKIGRAISALSDLCEPGAAGGLRTDVRDAAPAGRESSRREPATGGIRRPGARFGRGTLDGAGRHR